MSGPEARPAQNGSTLAAEITEGVRAAAEALGEGTDLPEPADGGEGGTAPSDLGSLWRQAKQVRLAYEEAVRRLEQREARVAGDELRVEQQQSEVAGREEAVGARESELRTMRVEFERRAAELDDRDQRVLEQEVALNVERERGREAILAEARKELAATLQRIEVERNTLQAAAERALAPLQDDLDRRRGELEAEQGRLAEERAHLRTWKVELEAQAEDLADARELHRDRVERAVASATEYWQLQCAHWEQQHRAAREHADRLEAEGGEHAAFMRALGSRSREEILADLEQLSALRAELRRLQLAPPDDAQRRLLALEEQWQGLVDECTTLRADNERLQRQLSGYQITATELERLRVTKEAQDAAVHAYRVTVEDLERRWSGLVKRQEGESPFPECTRMDRDYTEPPEGLVDRLPPLPQLVARIQAIIRQQHEIYYEEADLRCFLAGLAASRLHLLEGISGIGKTQLPQRFAEAIGASSTVISVGADWRTPQDLMGYYNAFERRFYESEFTQALYRAQCPSYRPLPFLIVLDEMNLSHPEQYFNDVLSALEKEADPAAIPELVLMNAGVDPAPLLLQERRKILVPGNVWFVGTANQDETTVLFADKTYDRAHVLELPGRYKPFTTEPVEPLAPLSMAALDAAFTTARAEYEAEREAVQEFLDGPLHARMVEDFRISWGNRLHRQVERFVPVIRACGGSILEAADHIVATKILRKLRGRYEVRLKDLQRLHHDLPAIFNALRESEPPTRSLRFLEEEERRRAGQT